LNASRDQELRQLRDHQFVGIDSKEVPLPSQKFHVLAHRHAREEYLLFEVAGLSDRPIFVLQLLQVALRLLY
jgi:hypothetical protein